LESSPEFAIATTPARPRGGRDTVRFDHSEELSDRCLSEAQTNTQALAKLSNWQLYKCPNRSGERNITSKTTGKTLEY
jgi:hypothetical protein